jgi:hypothetical protein
MFEPALALGIFPPKEDPAGDHFSVSNGYNLEPVVFLLGRDGDRY